jgi:hypothetical protein
MRSTTIYLVGIASAAGAVLALAAPASAAPAGTQNHQIQGAASTSESPSDGCFGRLCATNSSSYGARINRTADDAAGLSISEGLRSQLGNRGTGIGGW